MNDVQADARPIGAASVLPPAPAPKGALDPHLLRRFPLIHDMMEPARRRMPHRFAGYLFGGADAEIGVARNRAAFERIELIPRYGRDMTGRSTAIELLGQRYAAPIGVAPVGFTSALWPGAERALAVAAERARLPFILSTYSIEPIEIIAKLAPTVTWFQLYRLETMEITLDLVECAKRSGVKVLVITVDIPVYSKRTRDFRDSLVFPPDWTPSLVWELMTAPVWTFQSFRLPYPLAGNLMPYAPKGLSRDAALRYVLRRQPRHAPSWEEIAVIRKRWPGKLVIKGLQHPDDARRAAELGADGIVVSNHGGRQLDMAPASIDCLPRIAEAVGDKLAVMLDSGVRSGGDVARALVRGAECCFAGRAFVAACAAMGNRGAAYAMQLLIKEISLALGQLGALTPAEILGKREIELEPAPSISSVHYMSSMT
jgi:L-lactate dehydrogenase (cytochrome)